MPAGCEPLGPPEGRRVDVSTVEQLQSALSNASSGDVIMVADGTYHLTEDLWMNVSGVTLRGASGDRDAVILDGSNGIYIGISVAADDVTIADVTLRSFDEHCVHVLGHWEDGVEGFTLYRSRLLDAAWAQTLKVSGGADQNPTHDGLVACNHIGYTDTAASDYTNGISMHHGIDWVIRDNVFQNIRAPGDVMTGPAVLVWSASENTIVERNVILDCYRGIAFGNPSHGPGDHIGGVIRNNFIVRTVRGDVGLELASATGAVVAFNTVALLGPNDSGQAAEAVGGATDGLWAYNLLTAHIAMRDGASGEDRGNVIDAGDSWFMDPSAGDLHLTSAAGRAQDAATALPEVPDDFDGDPRSGDACDVGADEM